LKPRPNKHTRAAHVPIIFQGHFLDLLLPAAAATGATNTKNVMMDNKRFLEEDFIPQCSFAQRRKNTQALFKTLA